MDRVDVVTTESALLWTEDCMDFLVETLEDVASDLVSDVRIGTSFLCGGVTICETGVSVF